MSSCGYLSTRDWILIHVTYTVNTTEWGREYTFNVWNILKVLLQLLVNVYRASTMMYKTHLGEISEYY